MPNPLEIFKLLPQTNCGRCGYPTCLAFSFALATGVVKPERCPEAPAELFSEFAPQEELPDEDFAWRVLKEVRKKAREVNWPEVAPRLGFEVLSPQELRIRYLDFWVRLFPEEARSEEGHELDPRDQILLFNYLSFAGESPLSGDFVGLEFFPHSVSKVATLRRYAEEKLAQTFTGKLSLLKRLLEDFVVSFPEDSPADLGAVVFVLPRLPLKIHFFEGDPEEGLASEVKILYDSQAIDYLDLESLVFCAERLTERLEEKLKEGPYGRA